MDDGLSSVGLELSLAPFTCEDGLFKNAPVVGQHDQHDPQISQ